MDTNLNTKEKIYFPIHNLFSLIAEILTKNGVETFLEDDIETTEKGEISSIDITYKLLRDLASKTISENDFVLALQKNLRAPQEKTESMLTDFKNKILPFAENVVEPQVEEKPANVNPVRPITEDNNIQETLPKEKLPKIISSPPEIRKTEEMPKKPSSADNYREPVE